MDELHKETLIALYNYKNGKEYIQKEKSPIILSTKIDNTKFYNKKSYNKFITDNPVYDNSKTKYFNGLGNSKRYIKAECIIDPIVNDSLIQYFDQTDVAIAKRKQYMDTFLKK